MYSEEFQFHYHRQHVSDNSYIFLAYIICKAFTISFLLLFPFHFFLYTLLTSYLWFSVARSIVLFSLPVIKHWTIIILEFCYTVGLFLKGNHYALSKYWDYENSVMSTSSEKSMINSVLQHTSSIGILKFCLFFRMKSKEGLRKVKKFTTKGFYKSIQMKQTMNTKKESAQWKNVCLI